MSQDEDARNAVEVLNVQINFICWNTKQRKYENLSENLEFLQVFKFGNRYWGGFWKDCLEERIESNGIGVK